MEKQKLEVTFMCENVKEFETLLETAFEMMKKKTLPIAYKFNEKGKKQYDLSFPPVEDEKSSPNQQLNSEVRNSSQP